MIAQKSEGCMRDALSILDKIVSFTNGEVNYQNTLEHLNILDADYYFKLIESMQQQDLAQEPCCCMMILIVRVLKVIW